MAVLPPDSLFLGLEISTQSLKATALNSSLQIVASESLQFDSALPHYETKGGAHIDPADSTRITASPLMWIEALELVLTKLKASGFPFLKVRAVSGSGQQHGTVYWAKGSREILRNLSNGSPLATQLSESFAIERGPIWMDNSTSTECREIEEKMGGAVGLARLTGSRAFERFSGPQIRKIAKTEPENYANTERISLVSSFGASLLIGDYAEVDSSDGGGMNLMDLKSRDWSGEVLQATAPGLHEKLGNIVPAHSIAGIIHSYYVDRYGFNPECRVVSWSGDNPCTLAGLGLDKTGDLALSLGTSDTILGVVSDPDPLLDAHVFPNPVDPPTYVVMICYKNGSLAREDVRDRCAEGLWGKFNELLDQTPALNNGNVGFYYRDHEILPNLPSGVHRFDKGGVPQNEFDTKIEVRAILEGQLVSMRGHSERIGMPSPPQRIIATGGASANRHLLRLAANVFGCHVYAMDQPDSAIVGAALRAAHGWVCEKVGAFVPFAKVIDCAVADCALKLNLVAEGGDEECHRIYGRAVQGRMSLESQLLDARIVEKPDQ